MSLQTDPDTFRQIIDPGIALRKDSECHVDIGDDRIRLRAVTEAETVYLDYSLPRQSIASVNSVEIGEFWVSLDSIADFLAISRGDVTVTLPSETDGKMLILQSGGLTYRAPSLIKPESHKLVDQKSYDVEGAVKIRHATVAKAVACANLIGDTLEIHLDPGTNSLKFEAAAKIGNDTFSQVLPATDFEWITKEESRLTIPIDILRDLTPTIPESIDAVIELAPNQLIYRIEMPVDNAELTVHVAERTEGFT